MRQIKTTQEQKLTEDIDKEVTIHGWGSIKKVRKHRESGQIDSIERIPTIEDGIATSKYLNFLES